MRSASTPCQLRVTSFASKSRLVDRHPLYVPASAAPHVRASHYGLRLAHCSEQYDHGPKITTTDWQTRSAGDEEVTNLEARGFDGWDHRRRRALVCVNGGRKLTPLELTRRHGVFRRRRQFAVVSLNDPLAGTIPVVIIRPQTEVEDEDELPVAFPARGSLDLLKLLT